MIMIRAFDMFCGAGGSSCGARSSGVEIVGGVDLWHVAADTHQLNFPDANVFRMKAESLSSNRLRNEVGSVELLLASPECTNHSVAKGNRPRCEKSRATAFEVVRYAKALSPRWIVVENVIQMQKWDRFEEWREKVHRLGYKTEIAVLNAKFHRTPQTRKRMILVADRENQPRVPLRNVETRKTVGSIIGCGEAKSEPWKFTKLTMKADATKARARRAIKKLGRDCPFIMVYYGSDGAGGFQALDRPLRTVTTIDRFAYVRPAKQGHEMRMLQPPELAAAMGFPRSYKWPSVSRRERVKLLGNAVCPEVTRDVVDALTR
jgi:DNA (cytosine-5)-methyltransferase 1